MIWFFFKNANVVFIEKSEFFFYKPPVSYKIFNFQENLHYDDLKRVSSLLHDMHDQWEAKSLEMRAILTGPNSFVTAIFLCSLDFGNIDDQYRGPSIKEKVWLSPAAAEWQVRPSPQAPPSLTVLPWLASKYCYKPLHLFDCYLIPPTKWFCHDGHPPIDHWQASADFCIWVGKLSLRANPAAASASTTVDSLQWLTSATSRAMSFLAFQFGRRTSAGRKSPCSQPCRFRSSYDRS